MAQKLMTPGVYIEELNAFPGSVVEVATAVPAFIGYTEKASRNGKALDMKPTRINSLSEYHDLFGGAFKPLFSINNFKEGDKHEITINGIKKAIIYPPEIIWYMYRGIQLFFNNGGGTCYIVSVGKYDEKDTKVNERLIGGLEPLLKEQEPTIIVIPDAVKLKDDCYDVYTKVLAHCAKMQSRVAILDIYNGDEARIVSSDPKVDIIANFREKIGTENLNYAAAYYPWINTNIVQKGDITFENLADYSETLDKLLPKVEEKAKEIVKELPKDDNGFFNAILKDKKDELKKVMSPDNKDIVNNTQNEETSLKWDSFVVSLLEKNNLVNTHTFILEVLKSDPVLIEQMVADNIADSKEKIYNLESISSPSDIETAVMNYLKEDKGKDFRKTLQDKQTELESALDYDEELNNKNTNKLKIVAEIDTDWQTLVKDLLDTKNLVNTHGVFLKVLTRNTELIDLASSNEQLIIEIKAKDVVFQYVPKENNKNAVIAVINQLKTTNPPGKIENILLEFLKVESNLVIFAKALKKNLKQLGQALDLDYYDVDAKIVPIQRPDSVTSGFVTLEFLKNVDNVEANKLWLNYIRNKKRNCHLGLVASSPTYVDLLAGITEVVNILPPSSAMAGIYTTVDNNRGVWKSPANISVNSVIKPTVNINHDEQENLNVDAISGKSINAIRTFPGIGTLVWGGRTLDGNSLDWKYINVRRTMIMLEQSIKLALRSYVFEPNDANTWVTVKSMLVNFLTEKWKQGALAGATPDDAFDVQVGLGSTMTGLDILEGKMLVSVKLAIVRPAEFIVVTFEQQMQKS